MTSSNGPLEGFQSQYRDITSMREAVLQIPANQFHPLVHIGGEPSIGADVYIGLFSEVNARGASVHIGNSSDIASFVSINVADSHLKCVGLSNEIQRRDIWIGERVFIGTHCAILGGTSIGDGSVIGAGVILHDVQIPPGSLVVGNPYVIKAGYYL